MKRSFPVLMLFIVFIGNTFAHQSSYVGKNSLWEIRPGILLRQSGDIQERDLLLTLRYPNEETVNVEISSSDWDVPCRTILEYSGREQVKSLFVPASDKRQFLQIKIKTEKTEESASMVINPVQPFEIYLIHHTHTDLGYTHYQENIEKLHMEYIDKAVAYAKATASRPEAEQFRWTCEAMWAVDLYLKNRSENEIKDFFEQVKNGRIEITGLYCNQTALSGYEEMVRMVTDAVTLRKTYNIPVSTAINSDVNGIPWAYASLLPAMGIDRLVMGINSVNGGAPFLDKRPNAFFWSGPDGKRVLVWNGLQYTRGNHLGILPVNEARYAPKAVSELFSELIKNSYPHDFGYLGVMGCRVMNDGRDNAPPNLKICDAVHNWNTEFLNPRLRTATLDDFFIRLEKDSENIPEYTGDWPDWWSDGIGSTPVECGLSRKTQVLLQAAGALAAVGDEPSFYAAEINRLYKENMIFDEHTWGGHNSVSEPWSPFHRSIWNWKSGHVYKAWNGALDLGYRLLKRYSSGKPFEIVAFNQFENIYNGPVWVSIRNFDRAGINKKNFTVFDEDGQIVPAEYVSGVHDRYLVLTTQIMPLSIKRFYVQVSDKSTAYKSRITVESTSIASPYYRLSWDESGITSWQDVKTGKELLDPSSSFQFGAAVYEKSLPNAGQSGRKTLQKSNYTPKFDRHVMRIDSIRVLDPGNARQAIRMYGQIPGFKQIETDICLWDNHPRIDVTVRFYKSTDYEPEALYIPFPVAIDNPDIYLDMPGAVVEPWKQQLPNTCQGYFAVQDWVAVGDKDGGVIVASEDAPLFQFGKIRTKDWNRSGPPRNGTVISWPINTYWYTNFAAYQEPRQFFHYYLTTFNGEFEANDASRFSRNTIRKPLAFYYANPEKGKQKMTTKPLIRIEPENLVMQTLCPAMEGQDLLLRLREVAGNETQGVISVADPEVRIFLASPDGATIKALKRKEQEFSFNIRGNECLTFRLEH